MQLKEQKISPIKQRILQFASTLGISKREFYIKIGVSRGTLESNTGITEDIVAKFIATYPEISTDWLLTGEGDMLKNNCTNNSTSIGENTSDVASTCSHDSNKEGIPLIPVNAMAGAFTGDVSIMEYECERYVIPAFRGADFLITVKGDSMRPSFNSGDIVACHKLALSDIFFQWNKVYVLDTNQGALIKRVKPGSDDDHIRIISDNSDFDPFELSKESIYNVALVLGVIKQL